jgi:predicted PurR-regulated permease PerM
MSEYLLMNTNKIARDLMFYIVLLIGVCGLIFTYRLLIGALVISLLLAYLLHPGISWIAKQSKINRRLIVPLVYIVFMGGLILILIYLSPIVVQQAKILTAGLQIIPDHIRKFESEIEYLTGVEIPLLSM